MQVSMVLECKDYEIISYNADRISYGLTENITC